MPATPVEATNSLKYVLEGRVVTMNASSSILLRGRIFVDSGEIVGVHSVGEGIVDGFSSSDIIKVGGTIYPGMIELHNHLPYNILPFWLPIKRFQNRGQWGRIKEYRKFITGPMQTLGKTAGYPGAIVRYTECKSLIGGVTTSQGWTLANSLIKKRYYRGLIRNVEETNDPELPEAETRIGDVTEAQAFLDSIKPDKTKLLHLSEGVDELARSFFTNLQIDEDHWAITDRLAGIHCTGLDPEDFEIFASKGGSMIWSPFSNIILYGDTAKIQSAKDHGIKIALGADWAPSGGKNLLEELKVAKLYSDHSGGIFTNQELVEMVSINPARILGWDAKLGSIEKGKKADLLVLIGYQDNAYDKLIEANEKNISLVVINGIPRWGQERLISKFPIDHAELEEVEIDNVTRQLYLKNENEDEVLEGVSLAQAIAKLAHGLTNIKQLAIDLEQGTGGGLLVGIDGEPDSEKWTLVPDNHPETEKDDAIEWGLLSGVNFSEIAIPLLLDGLAVADDDLHFELLSIQPNIPEYIREGLPVLYGKTPKQGVNNPYVLSNQQIASAIPLEVFVKTSSNLRRQDKLLIVQQAMLLLDQVYVHLPLKRSMYAANPLEKLKVIQTNLVRFEDHVLNNDNVFHREMLEIFSSLRDLHTNYILPEPYKYRYVYLPFLVEEYFDFQEDDSARFMITKVLGGVEEQYPDFKEGVEIISWNNSPVEWIVQTNARRQSGSNAVARRARGIDTLTIRPLATNSAPNELLVSLQYRARNSEVVKQANFQWVVSYFPPRYQEEEGVKGTTILANGMDYQTNAVNHIKELFFGAAETAQVAEDTWHRPKNFPGLMRGKIISNNSRRDSKSAGYIRIFSFNADNAEDFLNDFSYLFDQFDQEKINGLILDIRGNGGGLITASEKLLQLLAGDVFQPQKAQFINSDITLALCKKHDHTSPYIDLSVWRDSINLSQQTGDIYSLSFPITEIKRLAKFASKPRLYDGPIVLITDALCYSAADIFAAGFKDHGLGPVLGIHENTGAGGANVWSQSQLKVLMDHNRQPDEQNPFKTLPNGAAMRVAVRRTLRQGSDRDRLPVEDLGIRPDHSHRMLAEDLIQNNVHLLNKAMDLLVQKQGPVDEIPLTAEL
ncbi:MAG: amidohydrolase family protein [Lewinella sp.]|nr:amidohydrolase family protein [Lewinella sp.]